MTRWWIVVALLLLAMVFSAQAPKEEKPKYVEGEVVVKYKQPDQVSTMAAGLGLSVKKTLAAASVAVLKDVSGRNVEDIIASLKADENVAYAEPNYLYYAMGTPNDPRFNELWGLHNTGQNGGVAGADISAVKAWDIQTGRADVLVAVIDTGVDYKHPDLAANMWTNPNEDAWSDPNNPATGNGIDDDGNGLVDDWRGWDFANDDNDPFDDNAHGTHVSGTIGAVGNNGVGVVGVNWTVRIMPLKFLSANGSGTLADAIAAITYAADHGAHIMNNSWGGGPFSQALKDAIELANNRGALFVAAAGNDGNDNDANANYPSNYKVPNVLAVAAADRNGNLAMFGSGGGGSICGCENPLPTPGSNFGATTVDLAAPGKEILSTTPNNSYQSFQGTSMATPHVVGVAALTLAQFPSLTNVQLKQRLMSSVDVRPGLQGKMVTNGMINAFKAVSAPLAAAELP